VSTAPDDDWPSAQITRPGLTTVSVVDALVADLTRWILSGHYQPGVRLPESTLAKEYGVSRHTLRSAMDRLTGVLLAFSPNKGWSVPSLSIEDFHDLAFLRTALEVECFRGLALKGQPVGADARAALNTMLASDEDAPDWSDRLLADMAFHRSLVDQAGSPRTSAAYRAVQSSLHLYLVQRQDWFGTQSVREWKDAHQAMADAIDSADPELVERTLREQFSYEITA